jgi:hypothetical protein
MLAIHLVVMYFYFPETKDLGLEEVAVIFDGPDALLGTNAVNMKGQDWDNKDGAVEYADNYGKLKSSSDGGKEATAKEVDLVV